MDVRIFKPLGWKTASLEVWDGQTLVAEVFADGEGVRRLYVSEEAARQGVEWGSFSKLAPGVGELLDLADEEMRRTRQALGESEV